MNDRDYSRGEDLVLSDAQAEPGATDPVEVAVASYLDFLEGLAGRPDLDQLTAGDRRRAVEVINSVLAGRGIELDSSTPSVEALLAGTELESLLRSPNVADDKHRPGGSDREVAQARAARPIDRERARVERIENVMRGADSRLLVRAGPHKLLGPAVAVAYLDLQAVFFPIDGFHPAITKQTCSLLGHLLSENADLDYVGVVADESNDLLTQLLSAGDLGPAAVTPSDDLQLTWPPVLPLPLALRAMLELAAPVWEPFVFDSSRREPLPLADIAADATDRVLAREVSRPYRGDKGRAYKSFAGSGTAFTGLIVRLGAAGASDAAVADAVDRIARDAA